MLLELKMAWYDFFLNKGSQSQEYSDYIRAIIYAVIFVSAIVFWIIITNKTRKNNSEITAHKTVKLVYVGVLIAVSILSFENFIQLLSPYSVNSIPSQLITLVGYTIVLYAFNLFLLLTVNFRQRTKKIIILLASIEVSLIVIIDVIMAICVFYELPIVIQDFSVIILGAVVILAVVFSIVNISLEIRNTANKLSKVKLSTALVGIIGFLLDGLANLGTIVMDSTGVAVAFSSVYRTYIVPVLSLFFYTMVIIGFFYSLYPPQWLQRRTGVLPPRFAEIMKTQTTSDQKVL
jgi:hypothetical protein